MSDFKELGECLVCGYDDLITHCDLGMQPLVNNLKDTADAPEQQFPILVNVCPRCTHKQLSIAVDPKLMFTNYLYQTGTSESHKKFFWDFSVLLENQGMRGKLLDIGCNDGSLLAEFKLTPEWKCTGIEPAKNLANIAAAKGISVINDFFPSEALISCNFNVITAFNVFAHNSDPHTFLKEMAKLLYIGGRIYILTTRDSMDSFYHEHVSYFTPRSMMTLAEKCGLIMNSFKEVSMHGNSYLFELSRPFGETTGMKAAREWNEINDYKKNIKNPLPTVGYGASANGIVLMNHFKFAPEYVIDDNPLKQGKFIPGVNVPIWSSSLLASDGRDLRIIIFAYHLFDEITAKIKAQRPGRNDKFIHPLRGAVQ